MTNRAGFPQGKAVIEIHSYAYVHRAFPDSFHHLLYAVWERIPSLATDLHKWSDSCGQVEFHTLTSSNTFISNRLLSCPHSELSSLPSLTQRATSSAWKCNPPPM